MARRILRGTIRASQMAAAERGGPRFETLQRHDNLMERDGYEHHFEQLCVEQTLGVLTYYSLASGFLHASIGQNRTCQREPVVEMSTRIQIFRDISTADPFDRSNLDRYLPVRKPLARE